MSPVLNGPACASSRDFHEPEHQIECLIRVDRRFLAHNAPSRPRSQSATGVKPAPLGSRQQPLFAISPIGQSVLLILKFVVRRAKMLSSVAVPSDVWVICFWLRLRRAV